MKKHSITLGKVFVILIFLSLSAKFYSQEKPNFKNNQTICFIGNRITQDGRYHMLLQTYFATRYPSIKLNYFNCGISGDVAKGMLDRFDKDILIHKPDYAFLTVGMNDIMSYLYDPTLKVHQKILDNRQKALENYFIRTEKLATKLINNNITTIFLTPSIYDQTTTLQTTNKFGINDALEKCSIHIRQLAKKHNALLVNFQPEMLRLNKQFQKKDPSKTKISQDRVHPEDTGHFIMMNTILNSMEKPNKVSEIKINAKKGINLSAYSNTPQNNQAKDIARLCELYHKRNGDLRIIGLVEYKKLKNYQGPNDLDSKRNYLKKTCRKTKREKLAPIYGQNDSAVF